MKSYIDIHTHYQGQETAPDVVNIYSWRIGREAVPPFPFAAGIHPWDASMSANDLFKDVCGCNALAIGEIGLDYSPAHKDNAKIQQDVFYTQLEIASLRGLPVIIHCVKSFSDTMAALRTHCIPVSILHGYIGNIQQAEEALRNGCFLAFGPRSLASPKTVEVIRRLPADRMFLETDTNSCDIRDIYACTAEIRSAKTDDLRLTIYDNFKTVFKHYDRMA